MEQETLLNEISHAFTLHGEHIDKKFAEMDKRFEEIDSRFEQIDKRFEEVEKRFDRLDLKVDGVRMDLSDTQKTSNFLLRKVAKHDDKLLDLSRQTK
ncbi:hypothetical protein [Ornithinibacillus sp. 179-J 7C1 HS]|uniref:hypothetical protein n=1 Tax=Ornithinibacillus sp. 179-J 7C1 HS TaxID=3142384 RepID=UPI0039A10C49